MTLSCLIQLSQLSDSERPILLTQPVRLAHFEEIIYRDKQAGKQRQWSKHCYLN